MNPRISARTTKTAGGPRRAPRSEEEKAEYLALFERSGKPVSAFCREHGLCEQTFYYWRKSVGLRPRPEPNRFRSEGGVPGAIREEREACVGILPGARAV